MVTVNNGSIESALCRCCKEPHSAMSIAFRQASHYGACLIIAVLVNACGGSGLAPVITKELGGEQVPPPAKPVPRVHGAMSPKQVPVYHVTARGDTLYAIAWRYGKDYRDLARWNGIPEPYKIYPGQHLYLKPHHLKPPRTTPIRQVPQKPPEPESPQLQAAPAPQPKSRADSHKVALTTPTRWVWPADGKLLRSNTWLAKQGLEILGQEGQPVKATAPGEVAYSGDGLIGYGKLIIIKHNNVYLSAYAHNRKLLVTEGSRVSRGQQIAEMGSTGTNQVKLYFEIRRNGKPVPPLEYLPKRNI